MVRSTFVTACRLATSPTSTSPFLANATTDGVVRLPSAFAMTVGSPPSRTETTELVVPRSMPTARAMSLTWDPCEVDGYALNDRRGATGRQVDLRVDGSGFFSACRDCPVRVLRAILDYVARSSDRAQ